VKRSLQALLICLGLTASVVLAGVELLMSDGQIVKGADVRRDGEVYLVTLEQGGVITLPVQLVSEVRLTGDPKPVVPRGTPVHPGLIEDGQPQQLAGDPVRAPRTSEQLKVFGEPAKFQKSIIDSEWVPTSDWDNDMIKQNNWAPSTWAEDIVDSSWEPESDWDNDMVKQNNFAPTTWSNSVIDNSWQPTDGFKN
jgi:hypothetical protein